jgi:formate-dependent nitrite reductase membrane component NrfD
MNLFVADPEWGWWIILYFFLGGIAAGAYFTATLIDLVGRGGDRALARLGYLIAFPLICLCGLFLIVDLNRPERFWHMLVRSEVVYEAFQLGWPWSGPSWRVMARAPLLKTWSPMSIGSWAISLFGLCSFLSFLGSLWPESRLGRLVRRGPVGRTVQLLGCAVGFFVAAYTGALLTATNQPLWSDSVWIAPLFLTSAASTGIATLILLARSRGVGFPESIHRLERADLWALGLEFVLFAVFLASLGAALSPVLRTTSGLLLVAGTLVLGLFVPLAIHLRLGITGRRNALLAAAFALLGGFLLRYGIVTAAPEMLTRGEAVLTGFSPEDGRWYGQPGADPGNRAADFAPRSKVFPQE